MIKTIDPALNIKLGKGIIKYPKNKLYSYFNLVGLITPIGFKGERYYISFTNNYMKFTTVYTIYIKNK